MKKISFVKVALATIVCIIGVLGIFYFNSFEFMGEKFLNMEFGEHTFVYPEDIAINMIDAAYEHNEQVSAWRLSEYGIDDNGWKFYFPTCDIYAISPVCEGASIGIIPEPQ